MPQSRVVLLTFLALSTGGAASAADHDFNDVQLNLSVLPGIKTVDANNNTMHTSSQIEGGASISFQHGEFIRDSQWGWMVGLDFFYDVQKGSTQQLNFKSDAHGDTIDAGAVYRITDNYRLELTPFFGLGGDYLKTNRVTGHGMFRKYGMKMSCYDKITHCLWLGVDLGWETYQGKARADFSDVGSDQSTVYKGNGPLAGVILSYRL